MVSQALLISDTHAARAGDDEGRNKGEMSMIGISARLGAVDATLPGRSEMRRIAKRESVNFMRGRKVKKAMLPSLWHLRECYVERGGGGRVLRGARLQKRQADTLSARCAVRINKTDERLVCEIQFLAPFCFFKVWSIFIGLLIFGLRPFFLDFLLKRAPSPILTSSRVV